MKHSPVYLVRKPKEKHLSGVTVRATKVKFYSKGDTLVYNADAFQLSEGSMLDVLIRQLPGVELKGDGRIYVNGKYVESLLLNGEYFFKGKSQILLENLPTYMVKNVRVYKKAGLLSEMVGKNVGDQQLVMDVKFKKQYSIGCIGNAEAAGGTENRYLAQLFALRFTTHSRLSFFGALNNVNERRKPGENTEWTPQQVGRALTTTRNSGADYLINDRNKRFKLEGNGVFRHNDDIYDNHTTSVNFLSGGNTYGQSSYRNRTHSFSLSSDHNFQFDWDKVKLRVQPAVSYAKNSARTLTVGGTFGTDPALYIKDGLQDSLFSPAFRADLLRQTLNRQRNESKNKGHDFNAGLSAVLTIKVPHTMDNILINVGGKYAENEHETFAHKLYDYPADTSHTSDFRNEYETEPYSSNNFQSKIAYMHFFGNNWNMQPYYQYARSQEKQRGSIYRLERLDDWNESTTNALGALPSVADWMKITLDCDQTQRTKQVKESHTIGYYLHKEQMLPTYWRMTLNLPLSFEREHYDYERPAIIDTSMLRTNVLFCPSLFVGNSWLKKDRQTGSELSRHDLEMTISSSTSAQPMRYNVTIPYSRSPLVKTLGNPDLKNSIMHTLNANYSFYSTLHLTSIGAYLNMGMTQNALCMGYTYDRQTGKRTYRPENVNGNCYTNGGLNFSFPFGKQRRFTLSGNSYVGFNRSVDLIGFEGESDGAKTKSIVHNLYMQQGLKIEYGIGMVKLGVKGNGTWTHATSRRADFATINAGDYNYGVTLKADMPAGFGISTDFTVYSRRGYVDKRMNTDDIVWNARLS